MIKIQPNLINNLSKTSSADFFQIRSISNQRFIKKIGNINQTELSKIKIGLTKVFSINS